MTDDTRTWIAGVEEAVGEAALIATFYGLRGGAPVRLLHERLYRYLSPEPDAANIPDRWENPVEGTFGRRFDPPGPTAHDTTAVQLALNADGAAAEAWKTMRQRLADALEAEQLDGIWGHTLVYQAVLKPGVDADAALEGLLPAIHQLHSPEDLRPLAAADVFGGRVWLLDIPDRSAGSATGTVYAALTLPEGEEALVGMFYGPAAELLIPDLLAHKGYHQMSQYVGGDLERRYVENLRYLQETTDDLLEALEEGYETRTEVLEEVFRMYLRLLPVVSGLKDLHVGLLQQLENYTRWRAGARGDDVIDFHRAQLETASLEMSLRIQPLEDALETADKAVSVARAQVEKEAEEARESRQRRIEAILAMVALALALPELIDRRAAQALFGLERHSVVAGLGIQIVIIAVVGSLLVAFALSVLERRRKRQSSGSGGGRTRKAE
jgi:hypothetical protein